MKKGFISALNRSQREAIGLLQIGTFLEYFDLMLYVHMAVLLNELFFPKTDPYTASLLGAFAFCSTYVLRPVGAIIFGYIGDTIGRKATVIITTAIMSMSCIMMANLPTYAQIGITASWIVTGCRILQGLSSMGEVTGAQVYVTEITQPPERYPAVAFIAVSTAIGGFVALGVASLVTHFGLNWRIAFWIGAGVAVVGSLARTRLRETPEFLAAKLKREKYPNQAQDKASKKTLLAFFLIYCGWPLSFYLAFVYFNPLLKEKFGLSSENIILHNLYVSVSFLVAYVATALLSYKIHPLKIVKVRGILAAILALLLPWLIESSTHPMHIFVIQTLLLCLSLSSLPFEPLLITNVPVFKRFTALSLIYAISRALVYVITSFGLVFLSHHFGNYGLLIVMLPITLGFMWGVRHFEGLESVKNEVRFFEDNTSANTKLAA